MQQRMEFNSEENLEKNSEETVEQKVEQGSEKANKTVSQNTDSSKEKISTSEQTEPQATAQNTQARNANSFFGRRMYLPCPDGAEDHLHVVGIDNEGITLGVVYGNPRILSMLALSTMLQVLGAANEEVNENKEEESRSFSM